MHTKQIDHCMFCLLQFFFITLSKEKERKMKMISEKVVQAARK